jgi:ZIP family zinc transporter
LGGSLVLRFKSSFDLFLGFSAGTIIGVALFDLIPEALDLAPQGVSNLSLMSAVAIGFGLYFTIHRTASLVAHGTIGQRQLAPAILTLHSFFDGLGIGLAFHVSSAAGAIVAIGVLGHDLIDGANTVTLSLSNGASSSIALGWLAADALAPLAGVLLASSIAVPAFWLPIMLAGFGGIFLYIGAVEFLPRSLGANRSVVTSLLGLAFIYAMIDLANRSAS